MIDQSGYARYCRLELHSRLADKTLDAVADTIRERAEGDSDIVFVVPDTNALYANSALESWRFREAERFALVLTPAVMRELDERKGHHPNPAVSEKAAKLIRMISECRRRGRLVDGVALAGRNRIQAWPMEPKMVLDIH